MLTRIFIVFLKKKKYMWKVKNFSIHFEIIFHISFLIFHFCISIGWNPWQINHSIKYWYPQYFANIVLSQNIKLHFFRNKSEKPPNCNLYHLSLRRYDKREKKLWEIKLLSPNWCWIEILNKSLNYMSISNVFTFKFGPSPSKKNCFICFNESSLKMIKNAFYFILKALSVL